MKTDEMQSLTELHEYIKIRRFFTLLKPCEHRKESYNAQLKFSGYTDMVLTIMDILKVSILALEAEGPYDETLITDSSTNVSKLLEIALQLIPMEEMQLLDEIHERYRHNEKRNIDSE